MKNFKKQLLAAAPLALLLASPALAQEETSGGDELRQSQIVVTGTRSADRTALETAVPVDVFPVEELTDTGRVELNQILTTTVPSFNFNQTAINDGTDIVRPATLRGLAPDQTLVLVNGKRRHHTALLRGGIASDEAILLFEVDPARRRLGELRSEVEGEGCARIDERARRVAVALRVAQPVAIIKDRVRVEAARDAVPALLARIAH